MSTLNSTDRLVLLSACVDPTTQRREEIVDAINNSQIDWEFFLDRSQDTLLAPIIYRCYSKLNLSRTFIPGNVFEKLKRIYDLVLSNNLRLSIHFEELLTQLEKRKIDVFALKGMDVIHSLYDDMGVRHTSDIDLLFKRQHTEQAREVFFSVGLKCQYFMPQRALSITNHPSPYKFYNDSVSYDFHLGFNKIYEKGQIPVEEVLARASIEKALPNSSFNCLDSNDNFVYLTQHLSQHFYSFDCKLVSFMDLIELIRKEKIQWNLVIERSVNWNCFETMSEMIFLISEYFRIEVPADIIVGVSNKKRMELKAIFETLLREPREILRKKYAYQGSTGFKSIGHLSIGKKFLYLGHRTFPDLDYLKSKYRSKDKSYLSLLLFHFYSISRIAIQHFSKKFK
jgi:hypothetical protein